MSGKTRGEGNIVGEKWWRLEGGRDDNGDGAVANVIALPRSFPRVRGNQENNEWLGCSATALSRRERTSRDRERERKREMMVQVEKRETEFWPRCSRWPGFHTGER